MLDQHDLEQYHRVNTWPAIVLAVQIPYKFVDFLEVDCRVDAEPCSPNLQIQAVLDFLRSLPAFLSPQSIIPHFLLLYEKMATFR